MSGLADHEQLATRLRAAGMCCAVRIHGAEFTQLVVSETPTGGSSLWMARDDSGVWWVVTWGGHFYTALPTVDLVLVAQASLTSPSRLYDLPAAVAKTFGLVEQDELPVFGGQRLEGWDSEEEGGAS